jgi:hypothetical protein
MTDQSTKNNDTSKLLRKLQDTPEIKNFMAGNANFLGVPPFHVYLSEICQQKGQIPEQVIKRSSIERSYGHQLFNGIRKPSRDKVIQLAIGLELDFAGTQKLLQMALKSALYPRIKRDAAIIHCILQKKDIFETQTLLNELGLTLLGGEEP